MLRSDPRPTFFDLLRIAQPVGAIASIGHRIGGVLLSLGTPAAMLLLDMSIRSAEGYAQASALLAGYPVRVALPLFVWALAHHVLAGIRHLLMDVDMGSHLITARRSAWFVNIGGAAVMLISAVAMW